MGFRREKGGVGVDVGIDVDVNVDIGLFSVIVI